MNGPIFIALFVPATLTKHSLLKNHEIDNDIGTYLLTLLTIASLTRYIVFIGILL